MKKISIPIFVLTTIPSVKSASTKTKITTTIDMNNNVTAMYQDFAVVDGNEIPIGSPAPIVFVGGNQQPLIDAVTAYYTTTFGGLL